MGGARCRRCPALAWLWTHAGGDAASDAAPLHGSNTHRSASSSSSSSAAAAATGATSAATALHTALLAGCPAAVEKENRTGLDDARCGRSEAASSSDGEATPDAAAAAAAAEPPLAPGEKFVFFVRHAQSQWNRHLDDLRKAERLLEDPSQAAPALKGAVALTAEISQGLLQEGHTDHKLSELGEAQARALCELVARERREFQQQRHNQLLLRRDCAAAPDRPVYYDNLFSRPLPVYCSPMLRAVQTAHLALPDDAGWGPLVLLKDAREVFGSWAERDCVGEAEGRGIVERATRECELPGLGERVDWARSDCEEGRWWSAGVEGEDAVNERLDALLRRLLDEDEASSCICVTHSNLIRRLMMRHGAVGSEDSGNCDACGSGCDRSCGGAAVKEDGAGEEVEEAGQVEDVASPTKEPQPQPLLSRSFHSDESWELPTCTPVTLQRVKVEKLQNCGVMGVRFAREQQGWVARDVCMLFGSKLEADLEA